METKDQAQFHIVLVKGWVEKEGKFLLAQRDEKETHVPGVWSLPGGKVENEITKNILQKTLQKELMEEVGVGVGDDMTMVYNNTFTRSDGAHVVAITFLCKHVLGEARPIEDTQDVAWLTLTELEHFDKAEDWLRDEINALCRFKKNI